MERWRSERDEKRWGSVAHENSHLFSHRGHELEICGSLLAFCFPVARALVECSEKSVKKKKRMSGIPPQGQTVTRKWTWCYFWSALIDWVTNNTKHKRLSFLSFHQVNPELKRFIDRQWHWVQNTKHFLVQASPVRGFADFLNHRISLGFGHKSISEIWYKYKSYLLHCSFETINL